uniref:Uncharacterized protein n=1 Tax=Rhizophora mucronata TaxID=61149 RepID=A0A2P2QCE2_RHIMU
MGNILPQKCIKLLIKCVFLLLVQLNCR